VSSRVALSEGLGALDLLSVRNEALKIVSAMIFTSLPATTKGTLKGADCLYEVNASSKPLRSGLPGA
jgi:hypothetical protein